MNTCTENTTSAILHSLYLDDMINKTKQELQKRLKYIQERLSKMKELEGKKLSELRDDVFAAFDRAMQAVNEKTNIFTELKKKKGN